MQDATVKLCHVCRPDWDRFHSLETFWKQIPKCFWNFTFLSQSAAATFRTSHDPPAGHTQIYPETHRNTHTHTIAREVRINVRWTRQALLTDFDILGLRIKMFSTQTCKIWIYEIWKTASSLIFFVFFVEMTVIYCIELYCTVLYWIVLSCTVLNCTVMHFDHYTVHGSSTVSLDAKILFYCIQRFWYSVPLFF